MPTSAGRARRQLPTTSRESLLSWRGRPACRCVGMMGQREGLERELGRLVEGRRPRGVGDRFWMHPDKNSLHAIPRLIDTHLSPWSCWLDCVRQVKCRSVQPGPGKMQVAIYWVVCVEPAGYINPLWYVPAHLRNIHNSYVPEMGSLFTLPPWTETSASMGWQLTQQHTTGCSETDNGKI